MTNPPPPEPAPGAPVHPLLPDDPFRGHEFDYEHHTDLFRCVFCREYEVTARDHGAAEPHAITACPGMQAWAPDGDARVHLAVTFTPTADADYGGLPSQLASTVFRTGLGRSRRYGYRDGTILFETSPSAADAVTREITAFRHPVTGHPVIYRVDRLTTDEANAVIAANITAYVAKYGPITR